MNYFFLVIFIGLLGLKTYSQSFADSILIEDNYSTTNKFIDLSKLLYWNDKNTIQSAFKLDYKEDDYSFGYKCLTVTDSCKNKTGYKPGSIRTASAFDYRFPQAISRDSNTITIEFDAIWEEFNDASWGESGRMVVSLVNNYPATGLKFGEIDSINKIAPFGRPMYNVRIRNHSKTGAHYSGGLMLYGGGHDVDGEFEKYKENDQYLYWLPGFSSEAGGGPPGQNPSGDFPYSGTQVNEDLCLASISEWKHYKWKIMPERLEFYTRNSEDTTNEQLIFFMQIPKYNPDNPDDSMAVIASMNDAHQTSITQLPELYKWYDNTQAIRIFFRAAERCFFANLKVSQTYPYQKPPIVSIEKSEIKNTIIYPNPVTENYFSIVTESNSDFLIAELISPTGQLILKNKLSNQGGYFYHKYKLSQLTQGLYFLKLSNQTTQITKKIIIQ